MWIILEVYDRERRRFYYEFYHYVNYRLWKGSVTRFTQCTRVNEVSLFFLWLYLSPLLGWTGIKVNDKDVSTRVMFQYTSLRHKDWELIYKVWSVIMSWGVLRERGGRFDLYVNHTWINILHKYQWIAS